MKNINNLVNILQREIRKNNNINNYYRIKYNEIKKKYNKTDIHYSLSVITNIIQSLIILNHFY